MAIQTKTIVVTFLAFLCGGIAGAYLTYQTANYFFIDTSMLEQAVSAEIETKALQGLRENDIGGSTKLLEARLDSRVVSLGTNESYSDETNMAIKRAIQQAREYRIKFPRKTDFPSTDAKVGEVLNSQENVSQHKP
jgi:hypothetical protein